MRPRRARLVVTRIAVWLSVAVVASLVAIPIWREVDEERQATHLLDTIHRVRRAVRAHAHDTGALAVERSGAIHTAAIHHELSLRQTYLGWKGPYLARPVSARDNPFGGFVYLYASFDGGTARPLGRGFRPGGPGGPVCEGAGQFLAFGDVPATVARRVDDMMDRGIPGDWRLHGGVQYDADRRHLMVFLLDT